MADFKIEIAGQVIAVTSLFESTKDYCRKYLTEGSADFSVAVTRQDLEEEQELLRQEALEEGLKPRVFGDPFLERNSIQRKVAELLLDRDILLMHGSTVAVDGKAYLFTADCGTGKSTHTRFWRQTFGDRAVMVNDDKPFLRIQSDGVLACGAPWSGKHGLETNITVPLQGICVLERGTENEICPAAAEELLPMLLHQGCPPRDETQVPHYERLVHILAQTVPLWKMRCNLDPNAARVAWEAMSVTK